MTTLIATPIQSEAVQLLRNFLNDWDKQSASTLIFSANEQFAIRIAFEWWLAEQRRRAYALAVPR